MTMTMRVRLHPPDNPPDSQSEESSQEEDASHCHTTSHTGLAFQSSLIFLGKIFAKKFLRSFFTALYKSAFFLNYYTRIQVNLIISFKMKHGAFTTVFGNVPSRVSSNIAVAQKLIEKPSLSKPSTVPIFFRLHILCFCYCMC